MLRFRKYQYIIYSSYYYHVFIVSTEKQNTIYFHIYIVLKLHIQGA